MTVALTDPNYDSESEGDEDLEREEEVDEKAAQDEVGGSCCYVCALIQWNWIVLCNNSCTQFSYYQDSSEIDNIDSEESEEPGQLGS